MIFVVVLSLAVYGVTAALFLFLAHRRVARLRRGMGFLLATTPLLLTGKALLTGRVLAPIDLVYRAEPFHALAGEYGIGRVANPLLVDVVSQMLPWRAAVREAVFSGKFPLWNPHVLGGSPLAGVMQPAVLHPGTWIGFLLPMPQAWTFDLTLRVFLGLLCAYLFFRGTGASEAAAYLGGVAWAFSDLLVFFLGYPVTPSIAPFPLLLLGLRRIAERRDARSVGLTVVALVLITIAGHPETLLFAVAGAGVVFLYELAVAARGARLRAVLLSAVAGALALGLTAIVLGPFVEALPQTWQHIIRVENFASGTRSDPPLESLRRLTISLVPHAYGVLGTSEVISRFMVPAGYVGTLLLPFACAGLGARTRRRWLWLGLGLLGLALHMRLAVLTEIVVALPLFDIAILDYFVFLWIFAAAALAVLGVDRLREGHGVRPFVAGIVGTAMATIVVTAYRAEGLRALQMSPGDLRVLLLMQIVPLLIALGLVLRRGRGLAAGIPVVVLVALFTAQRALEEAKVYPSYPARAFYPALPVLDAIPRGVPERMTGLWYAFVPNVSAIYGLEDVRGYDAMLFAPYQQTYALWCHQLPTFFNRVRDPEAPFLSFLNVRYVVSPTGVAVPRGWKILSEGNGVRVLENPRALPRAFVPKNVLWTPGGEHVALLGRITDFAHDGLAADRENARTGWQYNGEARVETRSYGGDRLRLTVDADKETFVGTSIPDWRGWKLYLDGRRAPLHRFNNAFLGFEAPAGRHDAELVYRPDGFVAGAAITLATALLCAYFGARSLAARSPRRGP